MGNMKKKFIIFSGVFILFLLAVYFLPLQRKIDVKLDGVECRIGDNEYDKELSINVSGTYNDYLFKDDTFLGTITIEGYGDVWSISSGKLRFSDNRSRLVILDKNNKTNDFGELVYRKGFNEILILVSEKIGENGSGWSSEDGVYIAAPAKNKAEAVNLSEELSENDKWISGIKWE